MITKEQKVDWILRVAVFGEFLGHGVLAIQGKPSWIGWIQDMLSVDPVTASTLLTLIGISDVLIAIAILCWRNVPRVILLWAAVWGLWTALLRPIVGESAWDFVERWANAGAPSALLLLRGWPKSLREWLVQK